MPPAVLPHFYSHDEGVNLRCVARGIFVGGFMAPTACAHLWRWRAIFNLYRDARPDLLHHASVVASWPFRDKHEIPAGLLDAALPFVAANRVGPENPREREPTGVLLCCQMGFSRSASVGYALLRRLDGLSHAEALARVECPEAVGVFPHATVLASARAWVRQGGR